MLGLTSNGVREKTFGDGSTAEREAQHEVRTLDAAGGTGESYAIGKTRVKDGDCDEVAALPP